MKSSITPAVTGAKPIRRYKEFFLVSFIKIDFMLTISCAVRYIVYGALV